MRACVCVVCTFVWSLVLWHWSTKWYKHINKSTYESQTMGIGVKLWTFCNTLMAVSSWRPSVKAMTGTRQKKALAPIHYYTDAILPTLCCAKGCMTGCKQRTTTNYYLSYWQKQNFLRAKFWNIISLIKACVQFPKKQNVLKPTVILRDIVFFLTVEWISIVQLCLAAIQRQLH